jgi:uncharacterized membrane protein (DUF2068 family)
MALPLVDEVATGESASGHGPRLAPKSGWVEVIALWRLLKAVLLVVVAVGALALLEGNVPELAQRLVAWLDLDPESDVAIKILELAPGLTSRRLVAIGAGSLAYAGLFATEAVGLLLRRVWGEWLTVFATASLIPFEAWELVRAPSWPKVAVLLANIAVVAFLVWRRRRAANCAETGRRG